MLKDKIAKLLEQATIQAQAEGRIPQVALPDILLEHPQNPEHGDYAATVALKLGRAAKMNPLGIAEAIAKLLPPIDGVERISVAAPGFINFAFSDGWLCRQVDEILSEAEHYGDSTLGQDTKVQLEFVSVNPTGPLHVGHGRGAVLGSTLTNVLSAVGYTVQKEYYVNDAGNQMQNFYASLYARYQEVLDLPAEIPSDGYHGDYVIQLAREIVAEKGDAFLNLESGEAIKELGQIGVEKIIASIKDDLQLLGVQFDDWFSEQTLYASGQFERALALLKQDNHVEEREGALWFASTGLGEDKDNVLIRSSGVPTYFAADIAYHYNKFLERGFDKVIDIWGADHQGHISRMKAAVGALGILPDRLQIIISQMVSLRRGEEQIRVSKRTGDIITLREVIDEVGPDVCRFSFLSRSANSQMDFDLELAKKESMDNPVYYVQYGHARIAGILRLAREMGIDYTKGNVSLLTDDAESDLIKKLLLFPETLEMVATNLEPHHLPYYAQDLATAFHNFYEKCRVITEDENLTAARLKLVEATRIVLAKTLRLMGMNAPERM
ncbi:MAG: arginine--tRNA ligase [Chloroflexi bacterium CG07_land_8_20_14_0_80_51_10]|nr:MAG: arginine--tRNA ligase [Chloroflexi bacterium CG07_land_8_20_14_0_80_51_10]